MIRTMLKSKVHRATVTEANIESRPLMQGPRGR